MGGTPRVGRRRALLAVALGGGLVIGCTQQVELMVAEVPDADAPAAPVEDARAPEPDRPLPVDRAQLRDVAAGEPQKCDQFTRPIRLEFDPPEVVVALDRSASMYARKGDKMWIAWVKQALSAYLGSNEGAVAFGYEEFPGRTTCDQTSACCASRVLVPPYLDSHGDIEQKWHCDAGAGGCIETRAESPSADALSRIRSYYENETDAATDRFVLLVTDGEPSCSIDPGQCDDAGREASRLFSMSGVRTMVLPIGDEAKKSHCLEGVAVMGQTRAPGSIDFPAVADPSQLGKQLDRAMTPVMARACRFIVRDNVTNPDQLLVTVNWMAVPRDQSHKDGWDFDASGAPEIQLYGPLCTKIKCNQVEHRAVKAQVNCMQCGSDVVCP
jgi:hypothetical protein